MADFGWAYIDCTETTGSAYGENRTVQFLTGAGNTSGTLNFTYYTGAYGSYSANTLVLTGTLVVSGTVSASHYHVENVTEIDSIRTGSLTVVNYNGSTVTLHASSSGNVGVGTATPGEKVDISLSGQNGGIRVINSTDNAYLKIDAPSDEAAYIDFGTTGSNDWQITRAPNSNDLAIYDNDGAAGYVFTWKQGGNIGIGTTSPSEKVDVSITGSNGGIRIANATDNAYLKIDAPSDEAAYIDFGTSGSGDWQISRAPNSNDLAIYDTDGAQDYIFTWKQGGKVGIGTTSPSQQLEVSGTTYLSGGLVHKRVSTTANYTVNNSDYYVGVGSGSGGIKLTLAAASACADGQTFVFKDEYGHAQTNNITISGSGTDTIDGQNTILLQSNYAAVSLYCNGSNKYFIY